MVVFLFLEMGDRFAPVNQHFQCGGLYPPHVQGLVIQAGEKARRVDTDDPVGFCTAQCGSIERVIVPPVFEVGKARLDRRVLH